MYSGNLSDIYHEHVECFPSYNWMLQREQTEKELYLQEITHIYNLVKDKECPNCNCKTLEPISLDEVSCTTCKEINSLKSL